MTSRRTWRESKTTRNPNDFTEQLQQATNSIDWSHVKWFECCYTENVRAQNLQRQGLDRLSIFRHGHPFDSVGFSRADVTTHLVRWWTPSDCRPDQNVSSESPHTWPSSLRNHVQVRVFRAVNYHTVLAIQDGDGQSNCPHRTDRGRGFHNSRSNSTGIRGNTVRRKMLMATPFVTERLSNERWFRIQIVHDALVGWPMAAWKKCEVTPNRIKRLTQAF